MAEVLEAQTGRALGSRSSGRLRREGYVPAVLYGLGMEPVHLSLEWPPLRRALNATGGGSSPLRIRVDGTEHLTLVKDLQRHPVRRDVLHIDFLAVDPDEKVNVDVPLVTTGVEALGTADQDKVVLELRSLAVACKPAAIPSEIQVDVSGLTADAQIRVADLTLPAGVTTDVDGEELVAHLVQVVDLMEAEEAAAEAEAAAPEGEGEAEAAPAGEAEASDAGAEAAPEGGD